jgi:hypothetical protein
VVYRIERVPGLRVAALGWVLALDLMSSNSQAQSASSAARPSAAIKGQPLVAVPPRGAPSQVPITSGAGPVTPAAAAPTTSGISPLNPTPGEFQKAEPVAPLAAFDSLLSRVVALRSRIAALTSVLFASRLRVELVAQDESARIASLSLSLDGGVIYAAPAQAHFERAEVVYEHAVAPGPHVLGIEIQRRDPGHPQYSAWQSSRFVVIVPETKQLWTRLELEDESSMGEASDPAEAGRYELRVKLDVEVGE